MSKLGQVLTLARWEAKRSVSLAGRNILPAALVLLILLGAATFLSSQSGLHLQSRIYTVGTDDPELAALLASDPRFTVYTGERFTLLRNRDAFDITVVRSAVYISPTDRGTAAAVALERVHDQYKNYLYSREEDLFAAYPLWIDLVPVVSELDFSAAESGTRVAAPPRRGPLTLPEGPVAFVPPPDPGIGMSVEDLRTGIIEAPDPALPVFRYTGYVTGSEATAPYRTPSQLSPPLPFDSIILVFMFIFPLYFIAQFFMMGIMNERIERQGEALLSAPVNPWVVICGKALPYAIGMVVISAAIILFIRGSPELILPLIPVMLFFLSSGLLIGLIARSFRELSFVSIFFSTCVTAYLFFPSIFANIHVISLISPLTLMVNSLQGEGFTAAEYVFSTSLFFVTSVVLFYAGVTNFREERLFSHEPLTSKIIQFISSGISRAHPCASLFSLAMLTVPFVFMVQMMLLVLLFNLPMPLSLVLLLVAAAGVEEVAKSLGLYTIATRFPGFLTWKALVAGSIVTALGFLVAEKLLLFVTISQIAESAFGTVLFSSLGLLYIPFLIHLVGILVTAAALKQGGPVAYLPGIMLATLVHCTCNLYLIRGWIW